MKAFSHEIIEGSLYPCFYPSVTDEGPINGLFDLAQFLKILVQKLWFKDCFNSVLCRAHCLTGPREDINIAVTDQAIIRTRLNQ